MVKTLDYASAGARQVASAKPLRPEIRVLLSVVYVLAWMGVGAVAGAVALGILGDEVFRHELWILRGDDFWGVGLAVGAVAGPVVGWRFRRSRWLHAACIALGLLGAGVALVLIVMLVHSRPFLWQVAVAAYLICGAAAVSLCTTGLLGRLLLRRAW